jgi:hypothetical protein
MSLTQTNYPVSFKFLNPEVKNKAIEIANSLIEGGFELEVSEVIALSNAKLWACYFNLRPREKRLHVHLVPHPKGWALISEDASLVYFLFSSKNDALVRARAFAKNEKLKLYIHSIAGNINDSESFVVNRPAADVEIQRTSSIPAKAEDTGSIIFENKRESIRKDRWLGRKVYGNIAATNRGY